MPIFEWEEYHQAYATWRDLTSHAKNHNSEIAFDEFLVGKLITGGWALQEKLELGEDPAKKMYWLNGPNAKTLYKAWKAQNGKD